MNDRYSVALTLPPMAACLLAAGEDEKAKELLETARSLFQEISIVLGVAWVEGILKSLEGR